MVNLKLLWRFQFALVNLNFPWQLHATVFASVLLYRIFTEYTLCITSVDLKGHLIKYSLRVLLIYIERVLNGDRIKYFKY